MSSTGYTILLVEDEKPIRDMMRFMLQQEGFAVLEAGDSNAMRAVIADMRPDLILLDWMLPGVSGIEIARSLRRDENTLDIPIILLTARGEEDDLVRGLEVGADDYMTKPFSNRELLARIRALLRRTAVAVEGLLDVHGLVLDASSARVSADGVNVHLGPTEFRLLHFFMAHPERVFNRTQLLDRVWGANVYVEECTVDVHIRRLRKALEPTGHDKFIQTVRGMGYRFSNSAE